MPLSIWGINNDRMRDIAGDVMDPVLTEFIGAVGNQCTVSCEVDNYLSLDGSFGLGRGRHGRSYPL